jgi:hypothetical protein
MNEDDVLDERRDADEIAAGTWGSTPTGPVHIVDSIDDLPAWRDHGGAPEPTNEAPKRAL